MTLSDQINDMISEVLRSSTWTSAGGNNPIENYVMEVRGLQNPNLENEIRELINKEFQSRQRQETAYDAHVQAYGRFKRESDTDRLQQLESTLGEVNSITSNPVAYIERLLPRLIPIMAPMLIPMIVPSVIENFINLMTQPGMPLDPRFTRFLDREWNSGLERQTQFNTMIGRRNVVVQTRAGWINQMGAGHSSVYKRVAEGTGIGPRIGTLVGMPDRAIGAGALQISG